MAEVPDTSNFYSSLHTLLSPKQVAVLFRTQGWRVYEPDDWDHLEVRCSWAELVIESAGPILLHGPVAEVEANAKRVLAILEQAGVAFTAESYGPNGETLQTFKG